MRRAIIPWVAAGLILLGGITGAVALANATVLGAGTFVAGYLDAIRRGDAASALEYAGVDPGSARPDLLVRSALAGLTSVHQRADVTQPDGTHRVTVDWVATDGVRGTTDFSVMRIGTWFGVFPRWGFATAPIATLRLTVLHDPRFTINALSTGTGAGKPGALDYAVFVPGDYRLRHDSALLTARGNRITAADPGAIIPSSVDVQPTAGFTTEVQRQSDAVLSECATQQVLFPTGCPFGYEVTNRVVGPPTWTIATFPDVEILPGEQYGTWAVAPTAGVAALTVKVQSLYDGSISTLKKNVPFNVDYLISDTAKTPVVIRPGTAG